MLYNVTVKVLSTGEKRSARMRSPESETVGEFHARITRKLFGCGYLPSSRDYAHVGRLTTPGSGPERGCTVLLSAISISVERA